MNEINVNYGTSCTCIYLSLLCSIIRHLPSLQVEAEGFKLNVNEEDNERLRESSAEPAEQGGGAAEMAEPRAASSNNNDDGDEEKLHVPQPPVAAAQTSKQPGAGRQDILLLSDESHKSAVSAKSGSGSGSGGGGGIHRTRGEPSSSSSGTGSRYSSGDKYTMMTFDDLDKGHSPKAPPPVAQGGGELEEEEEPTDLSYEQWATGDQVRYNIIPNICTCTCT